MLLEMLYCRENEEGLYLWMQSFFTLILSHQRGHFNWHKTTCLSINTPQDKTVKSWCFASIGNVWYQWKNENFSLKILLKLLSGLPECANLDNDFFFFWFSLKFTPCLSISIAFSSILLSRLLFCNLCYPVSGFLPLELYLQLQYVCASISHQSFT